MPFVTTLHGRIDLPELTDCFQPCFAVAPFISISDAQRTPLACANWVGTVHHGLPERLLKPNFAPTGYLAFLGRISPEKGPETAIRIARTARMPLKVAAKVDKADQNYFQREMMPLLGGSDVEFLGEIDEGQKAEFLGGSPHRLPPR